MVSFDGRVTVTRGHSRVLSESASSVFAVAGVAVESGIRMSSGALPGPDLVRAARDSALEGLCARVAYFLTQKKCTTNSRARKCCHLRQQLSCRWLYRARAVQLLRFVDSLTSHCTTPKTGRDAYHHPQRRDVVRNRAEVNERRGCAIALVTRPRRRADVERAGTDAINRAGAAAAPARSRASSRRSTA